MFSMRKDVGALLSHVPHRALESDNVLAKIVVRGSMAA